MPIKSAFAAEMASSLTKLLPDMFGGQFLFSQGPDCSI
jgi:hypothetical protein